MTSHHVTSQFRALHIWIVKKKKKLKGLQGKNHFKFQMNMLGNLLNNFVVEIIYTEHVYKLCTL